MYVTRSCITFVMLFAKSASKFEPVPGNHLHSTTVRLPTEQLQLLRLGHWYEVHTLDGFVFFGSACNFFQAITGVLQRNADRCVTERIKWLLVDMSTVNGIDDTAVGTLKKVVNSAGQQKVGVVWVGCNPLIKHRMAAGGVHVEVDLVTLDTALHWVEMQILELSDSLNTHWLVTEDCHRIYLSSTLLTATSSFAAVMGNSVNLHSLFRYSEEKLLLAGDKFAACNQDHLHLLQSGRLCMTVAHSKQSSNHHLFPGAFFNQTVMYTKGRKVAWVVEAEQDSILQNFSREALHNMERQDLKIHNELLKAVLRQTERQLTPSRVKMDKPSEENMAFKWRIMERLNAILKKKTRNVEPSSDGPTAASTPSWDPLRKAVSAVGWGGVLELEYGDQVCSILEGKPGEEMSRVELTEAQREDYNKVYAMLDRNSSGGIDVEDMVLFSGLAKLRQEDLAKLMEMMLQGCKDKDQLNREEFVDFLRQCLVMDVPKSLADRWMQLLKKRSVEGGVEGVWNRADIQACLDQLDLAVTQERLEQLFTQADMDHSGELDEEEALLVLGLMKHQALTEKRLLAAMCSTFFPGQAHKAPNLVTVADLTTRLQVTPEAAKEMIFQAAGSDSDGVSFKQFSSVVLGAHQDLGHKIASLDV